MWQVWRENQLFHRETHLDVLTQSINDPKSEVITLMVLYDNIGRTYDSTRKADQYIVNRIIEYLDIPFGSKVVDIGCGTGNYTIALQKFGFKMCGVDCSQEMLKQAISKCNTVEWVLSTAEDLRLNDLSFDGAICTLAIHHFDSIHSAFSEIYRVIKNGKFVIFTCSHEQLRHYWLYEFFPEVIEQITTYMPDLPVVIEALTSVGFTINKIDPYFISDDLQDNFLGSQKNHPEKYLDPSFRNGMSIFAAKANTQFVEKGCKKIEASITSGNFSIKENPYGDYLFIVASK